MTSRWYRFDKKLFAFDVAGHINGSSLQTIQIESFSMRTRAPSDCVYSFFFGIPNKFNVYLISANGEWMTKSFSNETLEKCAQIASVQNLWWSLNGFYMCPHVYGCARVGIVVHAILPFRCCCYSVILLFIWLAMSLFHTFQANR